MELSVVILNKDKPELIDNCLRSLFNHTMGLDFEVLLGDTGSSEEIFTSVYSKYKSNHPANFKVIRAGTYHFSKNNNLVAKSASGQFLLFLNNDTLILDNALLSMCHFLKSDSGIGVLGPKLIFGYNYKIQHAGIEFFNHPIYGILGFHPYAGKHSTLNDVNKKRYVPAVTGACLLIRQEDFNAVRGFDENYVSEAQDVDLCLKINRLGKKIVYDGQTTVIHLENGSRPLGEENKVDRRLLIKKWRSEISSFLKQPYQFKYYQAAEQNTFSISQKILFERIKARGDVLASLRLCKLIKTANPNTHITFKTEFPDLVDSSPFVDRVLGVGEIDTWKYDLHYLPTYEDGTWKNSNLKWIEQMYRSMGFYDVIPDEVMELRFSQYDHLVAKANIVGLPSKYVVINTGAGWSEREWSPDQWEILCKEMNRLGYGVVQIGGESDYQVSNAVLRLNKNLQTNYQIINTSVGAIVLDSFPLHIAMMTNKPIVVLTCKTCGSTVWFRSQVKEVRNVRALTTPLPNCREVGCRLKYGNGLDNPCATPILKDLEAQYVFDLAKTHFLLLGEQNASR